MLSFQELHVYQRTSEFISLTREIATAAPKGNAALLDQLKRASTSVLYNIAEAAGRSGATDIASRYAIARGSAMECAAVLDSLKLLGLIDASMHKRGMLLLERIVAMLTKLCRVGLMASPSPSPSTSPTTSTARTSTSTSTSTGGPSAE